MREKTLGQIYNEVAGKEKDTRDPNEISRQVMADKFNDLLDVVEAGRKFYEGDFFIKMIFKKERKFGPTLLPRIFIEHCRDCPTPDYDQNIFRYNKHDDTLEHIWTIPDRETCFTYIENKEIVVKEEQQLLQYILDFADGTLYKKAKQFNREEKHSNIIIT